jgi:hypothetical protein
MLTLRRQKQIIGIDLRESCLNAALVGVDHKTGKLSVLDYAIQQLGEDGDPVDLALKLMLHKLRPKTRECAVAAWPKGAVLQLSDRGSSGQGKGKGGKPEDYVFESSDVGDGEKTSAGRRHIECGVPRAVLDNVRATFLKAKLNVSLLQLTPVAVFNAFQHSQQEAVQHGEFLLVDIGWNSTIIISASTNKLHLMRTIEWGAEHMKRTFVEAGLLGVQDEIEAMPADALDADEIKETALGPLVREVEQSINYLDSRSEGSINDETYFSAGDAEYESGRPKGIYVSGHLTSCNPFMHALALSTELRCIVWNPFRAMTAAKAALSDFSLLKDLSHLPAAAGAAVQKIA